MDRKLEARIRRLEKMLNRKSPMNESAEYSAYENMAIDACKKAFDALNQAVFHTSTISLDDNWSNINWDRVAKDLENALSYFPTEELSKVSKR